LKRAGKDPVDRSGGRGYVSNKALGLGRKKSAYNILCEAMNAALPKYAHRRLRSKTSVSRFDLILAKYRQLGEAERMTFAKKAEEATHEHQRLRQAAAITVDMAATLGDSAVTHDGVAGRADDEPPDRVDPDPHGSGAGRADVEPLVGVALNPHGSGALRLIGSPQHVPSVPPSSQDVWVRLDLATHTPSVAAMASEMSPAAVDASSFASKVLTWIDISSGAKRRLGVVCGEPLGGGTFGQCFQVSDVDSGQMMCGKFVNGGDVAELSRSSIRKEFAAMSRLHHPNLLKAIGLCYASDGVAEALLLPLADGTWRAWIEARPAILADAGGTSVAKAGLLDWRCRACLIQMASAVAHMHGRDIVHLDLKPENVLMMGRSDSLWAVVADFGQCRCTCTADGIPYEVLSADMVNSVLYRPLELFSFGGRRVSPRKRYDLWAFGCMMFDVAARDHPQWRSKSDKLLRMFAGVSMEQPAAAIVNIRNARLARYLHPTMVSMVLLATPQSAATRDQCTAVVLYNRLLDLPTCGAGPLH